MASISDEETNNENVPEYAGRNVRLNQVLSVQGIDDRAHGGYYYGEPLAEAQAPAQDPVGWGISDFRPIVHRIVRLFKRKPTREHDEYLCRLFLDQASQQFHISEDANNMLMVIDTFIPDVYRACVYRSANHRSRYGSWRTQMDRVETRSFLHTIMDYLSGNIFDTIRVKRFGPENASTITVDTIHAMTFGKGNDVTDAFQNRYVLIHWRLVHSVELQKGQQMISLQNQDMLTWVSRFESHE